MNNSLHKILFLQMPWSPIETPSLALGILKEICIQESVSSRVIYPNLDLYALLGQNISDCFTKDNFIGLSEHLFAADLFGKDKINSDNNLESILKIYKDNNQMDSNQEKLDYKSLKNIRDNIIPNFLEFISKRIIKFSPTIIGFSATFNQVMSSLALAKRVKDINSNIKIIMGGANFHDYMGVEIHRTFPEIIDHVFTGEGEGSLRTFLHFIKNGKSIKNIPGVTTYNEGKINFNQTSILENLNKSPTPNFDDYFHEINRIKKEYGKIIFNKYIPFESSRGCWWGEKSQCVFCGNIKHLIKHREKDVNHVIGDIITLSNKYKNSNLRAGDWIYPKKNFNNIINNLKDLNYDLTIFYEVRPDLKKSQIILMKDAGIETIQAGIESLSTPFLKLLRKGTTAIRNIQFMRWCKEANIDLSYNILGAFPGDKLEWYLNMADLFNKIHHLNPPNHHLDIIMMHRFSPFQELKDDFNVDWYEIRPDIKINYPKDISPSKFCYSLWYGSKEKTPLNEYLNTVNNAIKKWIESYNNSNYTYRISPGFITINDNRSKEGRIFRLSDIYQDVVLLCDEVQIYKRLIQDLSIIYPHEAANGAIKSIIQEMIKENILISEGNKILTLPTGYRNRTTEELREYVFNN